LQIVKFEAAGSIVCFGGRFGGASSEQGFGMHLIGFRQRATKLE